MDGPVEFESLLKDAADGMLTDETLVSRGGDDSWVPLRLAKLRHMGSPAVKIKAAENQEIAPEPTPAPATHTHNDVASDLECAFIVLGIVQLLAAVAFGIAFLNIDGVARTFWVGLAAGTSVSGLLFFAVAKALGYLRQILAELKRRP